MTADEVTKTEIAFDVDGDIWAHTDGKWRYLTDTSPSTWTDWDGRDELPDGLYVKLSEEASMALQLKLLPSN